MAPHLHRGLPRGHAAQQQIRLRGLRTECQRPLLPLVLYERQRIRRAHLGIGQRGLYDRLSEHGCYGLSHRARREWCRWLLHQIDHPFYGLLGQNLQKAHRCRQLLPGRLRQPVFADEHPEDHPHGHSLHQRAREGDRILQIQSGRGVHRQGLPARGRPHRRTQHLLRALSQSRRTGQ